MKRKDSYCSIFGEDSPTTLQLRLFSYMLPSCGMIWKCSYQPLSDISTLAYFRDPVIEKKKILLYLLIALVVTK